jgi:hypothetical protein
MAIYQVDDHWACASGGTWLPGSYESRKACNIAFRVDCVALSDAWEAKRGPDGTIPRGVHFTEEELRAIIRATRAALAEDDTPGEKE